MYRARKISCAILFGLILTTGGRICAANAGTQVDLTVIGQGQMAVQGEDLWRVFVGLTNKSNHQVSLLLSPTIVDDDGTKYTMVPLLEAFPFKSRVRSLLTVIPKNTSFELTKDIQLRINLQPIEKTSIPITLLLPFKIPSGVKPIWIELFPKGPRADISKVPIMPLFATPKVKVGRQLPGVSISINKAARALATPGPVGDEASMPTFPGFTAALKAVDPMFGSNVKATTLTDFSIRPGDVWLLASISFKNVGQFVIEVPLNKIIIVPKVAENKVTYAPVGIATKGRVKFGSPFPENITVGTNATVTVVLVYRTELWMDEYTLTSR